MAIKLGELLVKEGIISSLQLEDALKSQVIFGGKLGTNLVELEALDESTLAKFLSKKLGVPYIAAARLMNIPQDVIHLLPQEIASKHKVIPLQLAKRRLTLAMADPSDLEAIDEIGFRTGYLIQPVVTTELRLVLALEKYYQVPRERRYVQVSRMLEQQDEQICEEVEEHACDTVEEPPPEPEPIDIPEAFEEPLGAAAPSLEPEPPPAPQEDWAVAEVEEMDLILQELAEARNREDIANIIAMYLGQKFSRAALFLIRQNNALGWKAMNNGDPVAGFDQFRISLVEPSAIRTILQGKSYFFGPLPDTPNDARIRSVLGGRGEEFALLVPISMMGKIVGVILVTSRDAELANHLLDLKKFASKAAMAFEILILKKKILMT